MNEKLENIISFRHFRRKQIFIIFIKQEKNDRKGQYNLEILSCITDRNECLNSLRKNLNPK